MENRKGQVKLVNVTNENSAEIMLYGMIGRWMDIDVNNLVKELDALKKTGCKNLTFFVNSEGGEVMQGQTLFAYLNRSDFAVTYVVDGVAASMMAMIMTNPKHTVIANKYSKFMYHRLNGQVCGNVDDVRSAADMMDKFETDLIDMFVNRTGIDKDKVKADYFNATDSWLTAQEAMDIRLVNEIRDGNPIIEEPKSLLDSREVFNHFSIQLLNINNKQKPEMKKVRSLLNLPEDATEAAMETAVTNIISEKTQLTAKLSAKDNEITELKDQIKVHNETKVKALIDQAIDAKKFGEDMRETYTKMANGDFEMAEKVIGKMQGVSSPVNHLGGTSVPNAEKDMSWDDYHKKGTLENLKAANPERFKELFKTKYGHEPK